MYGINQVTLMGNIGSDITTGSDASGTIYANLNLATSKPGAKDAATGARKEYTEWHKIVFLGKLAEVISDFGKKGSRIMVQGELRTRKWEKNGEARYTTEIWVTPFEGTLRLLDGRPEGQSSLKPDAEAEKPKDQKAGRGRARNQAAAPVTDDEEVPF